MLAATEGVYFLKRKTFKNGCVKIIAGGMNLCEEAASTFVKMKEDARDIRYDTKMSNNQAGDKCESTEK